MKKIVPQIRLALLQTFLSAAFFLTGSCNSEENLVVVNLIGDFPPELSSLRVRSSIGTLVGQNKLLEASTRGFVIQVPNGSSSMLTVNVDGLSSTNCVVAQSPGVSVNLGGGYPITTSATLAALGTAACPLSVSFTDVNVGRIVSTPDGINCATAESPAPGCSADFPVGTKVSLALTTSSTTFPAGWGPPCSTQPSKSGCQVTVPSAPLTVRTTVAPRSCSTQGFCTMHPLQGQVNATWFLAIWGTSANDVWAGGVGGKLVHCTSQECLPVITPTTLSITTIWGAAAGDVYFGCEGGVILHWDGQALAMVATPTVKNLSNIYGASSTNVRAAGDTGILLAKVGPSWAIENSNTTQTLGGLWSDPAGNFFAVGSNGTVQRLSAGTWSSIASGTTIFLNKIWGSSRTNLWIIGNGATLLNYDGNTAFTPVNTVPLGVAPAAGLRSIYGTSATDVWVVGDAGTILHKDTGNWTAIQPSTLGSTVQYYAVWESSAGDVWIGGTDTNTNTGILLRK